MTTVVKNTGNRSLANFFKTPATTKFLDETLKDKKTEFVSNLIALSDSDKNLKECEPQKLMMCALNATALNLPLNKNLGYAYVIAYKGVPSFQIGYKGFIQLAIRTGQYKTLNACEVREGEIERNKFTGEIKFLGEKPENEIIGYVSTLELKSGFIASLYMTEDQIEKHALKYSKSYAYDKSKNTKSSKWSDKDERPKMAIKTVLKGLLNTYGVLSTEMQTALSNDNDNEKESSSNRAGNVEDATIVQGDAHPKKINIKDV